MLIQEEGICSCETERHEPFLDHGELFFIVMTLPSTKQHYDEPMICTHDP